MSRVIEQPRNEDDLRQATSWKFNLAEQIISQMIRQLFTHKKKYLYEYYVL